MKTLLAAFLPNSMRLRSGRGESNEDVVPHEYGKSMY
jgi:hypothetical protein